MNNTIKFGVVFCLWAGGLAACQTVAPPVQAPSVQLDLAAVQQRLDERQKAMTDVKSMVKTRVQAKEQNHTLKQVIAIQGNSSLRLDTLSMFGQPLGVLIAHQDRVLLYDVKSNRLYRDEEVWNIMYRTFKTVFNFGKYIRAFSGKIPRWEYLDLKTMRWDPETGNYRIEAEDTGRREKIEIEVDSQKILPVKVIQWKEGRQQAAITWRDYEEVEGRLFPHTITVERLTRGDALTMEFRNPKINAGIPEDSFQLNLVQNP
ncbi:MAG: DUF4292 domain-containing protein [Nitrospinaceae bacterium]|nr:outer membrane lipoprotein-sorting protein [Nitrospinaceae bacterium]NIR56190.1 outer membrane lipoprotein-sorting protein [Nitrospinaceae bacterium]NIS86646.1 outer membrane lipoprotein-sorting protein [Nitrospinaceae bacterium]NIT83479.1 outer membrane lipoprotein-sorting protein [Nitrospinaceae bacterium]NIU45684.1 outer membrane lipoprotein-sorting protein [Nitrospinaceae bacterium]